MRIPIVIVQDLSKEMDPEGSELRKKHRLKRRSYQILGHTMLGTSTGMTCNGVFVFTVLLTGSVEGGFGLRLSVPTIFLIK